MLIYGKEVSANTRAALAEDVKGFVGKYGRKPCLAVIIVGEDPASQTYVGFDEKYLLSLIPDAKDVDGFSPTNMGLLAMNAPRTISCTPFGVMKLLASTGQPLAGKRAVVIGRSNTVGKPMAMLLLNADCTVTVCHSKTEDLAAIAREADILVAAIGKPKFVTADMVKEGATVIDVGINRVDGKLVGDVDFENVKDKAAYITPVPGGVGPMTITMLLCNTLQAAEKAEESAKA